MGRKYRGRKRIDALHVLSWLAFLERLMILRFRRWAMLFERLGQSARCRRRHWLTLQESTEAIWAKSSVVNAMSLCSISSELRLRLASQLRRCLAGQGFRWSAGGAHSDLKGGVGVDQVMQSVAPRDR